MERIRFPPIAGVRVLGESRARTDRDKPLRAALREFFEQPVARRLPFVIHVGFVGKAKDKNPAALDRFAPVIERIRNTVNDIIRHGGVDLAGQFDEARVVLELSRLPRQVERIDRNAVPA